MTKPRRFKRHWPGNTRFVHGAVRLKDLVYVCVCDDSLLKKKVPHSSFTAYDRRAWTDAGDRDWHTVSMAVARRPKEQMIAISDHGRAWFYGNKDQHEEVIQDGRLRASGRGALRVVRCVEGMVYAAGMNRQVWRREGENAWSCMDRSVHTSRALAGFEGIDGFSSKEIYAAGWGGELWRWNGRTWAQAKSPTRSNLSDLIRGGDRLYAIGRLGLLVEGRGERWKVLPQNTAEDLWGAAWFDGALWVASLTQLYRLEKDLLQPVKFEDARPETCGRLSAADGVLWSVGSRDLWSFDGRSWTRVE